MTLRCDLFLPGLLTPKRPQDSAHPAQSVLTDLRKLMHGASEQKSASCEAMLAEQLKMPMLAEAAWSAAQADYPINRQWFLVEPVQVKTEHNAIYLLGNAGLSLDEESAQGLCQELAKMEQESHWQFTMLAPHRWLMFADKLADVQTVSLAKAVGRDLRDTWATGADAPRLQRHMTEWQMWLHSHPVNQARAPHEQIHALWVSGNAVSVTPSAFPWSLVYSDADWMQGLAKMRGVSRYELSRLHGTNLNENTLIWIDALKMPFAHGNREQWQQQFQHVLTTVLEPLLNNAIDMFDELYLHADNGRAYVWRRRERWKFWRGAPALSIATEADES